MSILPHAQNTTVSGGINTAAARDVVYNISISASVPAAGLRRRFNVTSRRAVFDSQSRSKAKKDPKAPMVKRALSAYMFFSQDWCERIKAENPDASFGEVGKLLGTKWKELDEEEKKPYIDQAARDKTRAEEEKAAYDKADKKSAASGNDEEEGQAE
ncbi:putative HMG-box domain containing protein [Lyophyllum shimeji]|uniref:HMG-box domain containing protein n=1 Tax=Lyophyllum shimeji TaxID=47721 RepID=A0A9P3UTY0_LYOSH|nr:putative HMG-box domain containing protein [Lyophyllum shimeji]